MKKNYILILAVLCFQLSKAADEVPNPGFENWASGNPVGWYTSNIPGTGFPITQSLVSHTGLYAAKGQAVLVSGFGDTLAPVLMAGDQVTGTAISQNYEAIEFYYQTNLTDGDIFDVKVFIYDGASYIIATGSEQITSNEGGWTKKTILLNYTGSTTAVKALIEFMLIPDPSSGRSYPLPSSSFIIDDVALTGVVGVEKTIEINTFEVFPTPAHNQLNIKAQANPNESFHLVLTDASGRVVTEKNSNPSSGNFINEELNLQGIAAGVYSLMMESDRRSLIRKVVIQ